MYFDSTQAMFDIADRLSTFPGLSGVVTVITEKPRVLQPGASLGSAMDRALSVISGKGACILVLEPDLGGTSLSDPLFFKTVAFEIVTFANLIMSSAASGAGLRSFQLARLSARALHLFDSPPDYGKFLIESIVPFRGAGLPVNAMEKFREANAEGHVLRIITQVQEDEITRLPIPTLSCEGTTAPQTVTATHTTAGAKIYYTVDGTYPGSGRRAVNGTANPASYIASGSTITVATACKLRVAAECSGHEPSCVAEAIFT